MCEGCSTLKTGGAFLGPYYMSDLITDPALWVGAGGSPPFLYPRPWRVDYQPESLCMVSILHLSSTVSLPTASQGSQAFSRDPQMMFLFP